MRQRAWTWVLAALVVVVAAVAVVVASTDDDGNGSAITTTSSAPSTTTTSGATSTTTTAPGPALPAVATPRVEGGGGSGEIAVSWEAVAEATGYRILRSDDRAGPFTEVADVDVTTGVTVAGDEAVNIWSAAHSYLPSEGPLSAPDLSPRFEYVEVADARQRCFRIVAYRGAEDAPASPVACAAST